MNVSGHRFTRRLLLPCAVAVVGAGSVAGTAQATRGAQPRQSVVMNGLDNPRGLSFAWAGEAGRRHDERGWSLYVAEAGTGGTLGARRSAARSASV